MINDVRYFFERYGFKVCSRVGDRLGIKASKIRIFFIYLSLLGGVGFAFYLTLAFLAKVKDMVYSKRSSVFDF